MSFIITTLILIILITNKVEPQLTSSSINYTLKSLLIGIFENIDKQVMDERSAFARIFEDANRTCMFEKLLLSDNKQDAEIQFNDEIFYDFENLRKLSVLTTALELCKNEKSNFESIKFLKEALKNCEVDEEALDCAKLKILRQHNEISQNCDNILDNLYKTYSTFDRQAVVAPLESFGFKKCINLVQEISKNSFYKLMLAGYEDSLEGQMPEILKSFKDERMIRFEIVMRCMLKTL